MLQHKGTTIISEVKDFFTSSEKAINTIFAVLSSLTLSEKRLRIQSKNNNEVKNINKLFLLLLFPFFDIKDVWHYKSSSLFQAYHHSKAKKVKRSKLLSCYYSEAVVYFNGIEVKLFFKKRSHRGKWTVLLTTDSTLKFERAYKIYATRWQIEVFFKESKQYPGLVKNQSQDFDAQISATTLTMIQY